MIKRPQSMLHKLSLKAKKIAFVDQFVTRLFQVWYDIPFAPLNFYSPLPDIHLVKNNLPRWYKEDISLSIDWNIEGQVKFAEHTAQYVSETNSLPQFSDVMKDGYGQGYGEVEAYLLYIILRHLKPSNIVEVGSGVSTFYSNIALQVNRVKDNIESKILCVEPYPLQKLRTMVSEQNINLQECEVQDIDIAIFSQLEANDVLFIDSSHVSKKDSDVDFLFLEVLPLLKKGVIIHVHDIPFPLPVVPLGHPLFDQYLFWNEASIVKAFLMFNSTFQIIMCQSYLHHVKPEVLKMLVPIYNPKLHFPSSLWLRKVI